VKETRKMISDEISFEINRERCHFDFSKFCYACLSDGHARFCNRSAKDDQ